jgi:phosphate transport system substrate-binding protein
MTDNQYCRGMNLHDLRTLPIVAVSLVAIGAAMPARAQVALTGAGATFPAPIYQKWFADYQPIGNAQINYQPNGSGGGIKAVTEGVTDFGASDMPLTDEQLSDYQSKHGFKVLLFPTVLGAVVPTYNLPSVKQALNFTPDALAGIFLGTITKWNDPAIASANKGVSLPDQTIQVAHRSDASGTTFVWTDYLSKVSPAWVQKVGKANAAVQWPVGIGGKGNDGLTGIVKQEEGALGYVELIYAIKNKLEYGNVRNSSNQFVTANLASVTAAAAGAAKSIPDDFRVSITNAPGKTAYPISTFTWLLVPSKFSDAAKKTTMIGFLKWAITKGQDEVETLDYAKLPASVASKELKAIAVIQ